MLMLQMETKALLNMVLTLKIVKLFTTEFQHKGLYKSFSACSQNLEYVLFLIILKIKIRVQID